MLFEDHSAQVNPLDPSDVSQSVVKKVVKQMDLFAGPQRICFYNIALLTGTHIVVVSYLCNHMPKTDECCVIRTMYHSILDTKPSRFSFYLDYCLIFFHPTELITFFNKSDELYWKMKFTLTLPNCAFDDYQNMRFFIRTLMDHRKDSIGGMLLGKTITNKSGWDPHEYICILMEEFNSAAFDNSIFYGYYNNRGMRTVDDGTVQMEKSKYFRERANQLAIQYPRASALLRTIAETYEQEANHDYVYSEIRDP